MNKATFEGFNIELSQTTVKVTNTATGEVETFTGYIGVEYDPISFSLVEYDPDSGMNVADLPDRVGVGYTVFEGDILGTYSINLYAFSLIPDEEPIE